MKYENATERKQEFKKMLENCTSYDPDIREIGASNLASEIEKSEE